MSSCMQTENQSVLQHGISVKNYTLKIINILKSGTIPNNYKIPDWMILYRNQIINNLLPINIIEEYTTYHDIGKPYCLIIDENGRKHFPNHSDVSKNKWLEISENLQVAKLIGMDMIIHTMKATDIDDFIKNQEAITLLVVALGEIHSNANMFGGINSDSFKIKYSQINRRGKQIVNKLFNGEI